MVQKTLAVTGMSCSGCERNVTDALERLDGVRAVEADHETDTVELVVADSVSDDIVHAAVERAGYEVTT